jgi:hypothetical protein
MAVKILKLVTGELLLADEVTDRSRTVETVLDPFRQNSYMHPVQMTISKQGIGLVLWMPHEQSKPVSIFCHNIVAEAPAEEALANEYREKFGGIITAPAGLIV